MFWRALSPGSAWEMHGGRKSILTVLGHGHPQVTCRGNSKACPADVPATTKDRSADQKLSPHTFSHLPQGWGWHCAETALPDQVNLLWEAGVDTRESWKHIQCWLGIGSSAPHNAVSPMALTSDRASQSCWGQDCNKPKHGVCPVSPDAAALWKTVLWIKRCCWFIPFPLAHVSHLSTLDCSLTKRLFLTSTG